jgi:actin related protein 2/3 complex subunit 1A/1B
MMTVSALDWSVKNQIMTGSYDRNVVVWSFDQVHNKWTTDLCIIQEQNRAILDGCWSPSGRKFAVGSAAKRAFVGYYEPANKWWNSIKITGFSASVMTVKFHPNERVLAIGSADHSVKVVSCYWPELDKEPGPAPNFKAMTKEFASVLWELKDAGGWVENLAWNKEGTTLAMAVHDGSIQSVDVAGDDSFSALTTRYVDELPFRNLIFHTKDEILAAGQQSFVFVYDKAAPESSKVKAKKKLEPAIGYPNGVKKTKSALEEKIGIFQSGIMQQPGKPAAAAPAKQWHTNPVL